MSAGIFLFKNCFPGAIRPLFGLPGVSQFMNKLTFRNFILAAFVVVVSLSQLTAQTPSTETLYDEVVNYVKTKVRDLVAKGKKVTREDQDSLQKAKKDLAAKYAATV